MAKSNSGYPWLLIIPHSGMIAGKIVCINGEQIKDFYFVNAWKFFML